MLALETFTFNPFQENTYVLYNERRECCIIDPGCYFQEEREELKTGIEKTGLTPVLLLNTHCHLDHIFGNQFVADTWGLLPHLHSREEAMLRLAPLAAERFQLPFVNYSGELVFIDETAPVSIGTEQLEILFTPGHSPGSISFYHAPGGYVIAGDTLFNGGIGRTDLPGGDLPTLTDSIRTRLYLLPDNTVVWPGHGPKTSIGHEKLTNPFVRIT